MVAAAAVGGLLTAAAACGDDGDGAEQEAGPVTIRFDWWGNPDRAAVTEEAIDLFEERNPDITVETSFAEFGAYFERLAVQISGGEAPDVLQMDYRFVREYADRGVLAALDSGPGQVDTSGLSPQLLSGGTVNDTLYAIPPTQNTQVFVYDHELWAEVGATAPAEGWTWTDLNAAAQAVHDETDGEVYGVSDFGGIEDWFEVWLRQQGKLLYTEDGALGYTADDVAAWWELSDSWRRSGAATTAELTTALDGSTSNDPVAQQAASSGFGYDSGFTPDTWEIMGRELTLSVFPSDSGTVGQYAKPAMMFSIAERSEQKEAAAALINFLINDPDAGEILGMSRGLPANLEVREIVGATLEGPPQVAFEFEQSVIDVLEAAPPPPPQGAGEIKARFQEIYDDVIFEQSTVQEAAQRFFDEAQQALGA